MPWVKSNNLASKTLGMVARRLPDEWLNVGKLKAVPNWV
jgi:hypothetical protein